MSSWITNIYSSAEKKKHLPADLVDEKIIQFVLFDDILRTVCMVMKMDVSIVDKDRPPIHTGQDHDCSIDTDRKRQDSKLSCK